ncbi:MAG: hypothetical protein ACLP5H_05080 [Desulfomonilaceae bacterium]
MESKFPDPDRILYVDVEFVSQKYEQITGIPAQSVMTRTEGGQPGIKAFFASAQVHTQESRTYPISSAKMLEEIFDKLQNKYGRIDLDTWENGKGSRIGWIAGNLSVGEWVSSRITGGKEEEKERHKYYALHRGDKLLGLLPKMEYCYPGFSDLLNLSAALMSNIDIPVEMLVRILYYAEVGGTYACVPLLAFESEASGT